jgi:hypothetical protein
VPPFEAVAGRVGYEVGVEPAGGGGKGVGVDAVDAGLAVHGAVAKAPHGAGGGDGEEPRALAGLLERDAEAVLVGAVEEDGVVHERVGHQAAAGSAWAGWSKVMGMRRQPAM